MPGANPLDEFISVSVVASFIAFNRYESWCIGFLGCPANVNDVETIRSGTSTVTSTVSKTKTLNPVRGTASSE